MICIRVYSHAYMSVHYYSTPWHAPGMDQLETCPMELEEGNALGELWRQTQASSPPKTQPLPLESDPVPLNVWEEGFGKRAISVLRSGRQVLIMPRKDRRVMEQPSPIEVEAGVFVDPQFL